MNRLLFTLPILLIFLSCEKIAENQKLYEISEIPIVDMHTHLNEKDEFSQAVRTMDEWGGTISITLNHNDTILRQFISDSLDNRILLAERGKHFTVDEVQEIKNLGYVGLKSHLRYHTRASEIADEQIKKMGELNLPFIAMHVADPPEDVYYDPVNFMVAQKDAERVIRKHAETIFIMAHGFYLTNRDADIDTLRSFFDRNPNLYVDIACTKWWDAPEPSYTKIRTLLIDYKDRFLFGTDFEVTRSAPAFKFIREKLETDKPLTFGMNGGPYPGLALPLDVLNHIYYWNAAKIIPGVKETLIDLGYEISDTPPTASPIIPGLDYSPDYVTVINHEDSQVISDKFTIGIDLSSYDRTVEGRLEILNKKKKVLQTIHKGIFKGNMLFDWNENDANGNKVEPGLYRVWLILENNKCAETVFELK